MRFDKSWEDEKNKNKSKNEEDTGKLFVEEEISSSSESSASSGLITRLLSRLSTNESKKPTSQSEAAGQKKMGKSISDGESSSSDYRSYNTDMLEADVATFNPKGKDKPETSDNPIKPSTSGNKKFSPKKPSVTFSKGLLNSLSGSTPDSSSSAKISKGSSNDSKTVWFDLNNDNEDKEPLKVQNEDGSNDSSGQYELASDKPFSERALDSDILNTQPTGGKSGPSKIDDVKNKPLQTSHNSIPDTKFPNDTAEMSKIGDAKSSNSKDSSSESKTSWFDWINNSQDQDAQRGQKNSNNINKPEALNSNKPSTEKTSADDDLTPDKKSPKTTTGENKSSSSIDSSLETNKSAKKKRNPTKTSDGSVTSKSSTEVDKSSENGSTETNKSKDSFKKTSANKKPSSSKRSLSSVDETDESTRDEDSRNDKSRDRGLEEKNSADEAPKQSKDSPDAASPYNPSKSINADEKSNYNKSGTVHKNNAGDRERRLFKTISDSESNNDFKDVNKEDSYSEKSGRFHSVADSEPSDNDKNASMKHDLNLNLFPTEPIESNEDIHLPSESEQEIMTVDDNDTIASGSTDSFHQDTRNLYPCGHKCRSNCHPGPCTNRGKCTKKVKVSCVCKRLKKEFPCEIVRNNAAVVDCDEECLKKQEAERKQQEALALQKEREEKLKNEKELQKYQKMFEGKKKNRGRRIRGEEEEQQTLLQKYWHVLVWLSGILLSIAIYALYS